MAAQSDQRGAPVKSAMERFVDRQRFALAVAGRDAQKFAEEHGFASWPECETYLRAQIADGNLTVPRRPVSPGAPAPEGDSGEPPAASTPGAKDAPLGGAPPAPPAAGPRPAPSSVGNVTIEKDARALMDANGVDAGLLLQFLGGHGTGRFHNVTAGDVERYLNG